MPFRTNVLAIAPIEDEYIAARLAMSEQLTKRGGDVVSTTNLAKAKELQDQIQLIDLQIQMKQAEKANQNQKNQQAADARKASASLQTKNTESSSNASAQSGEVQQSAGSAIVDVFA